MPRLAAQEPNGSYIAQAWRGQERTFEARGLPLVEARRIAMQAGADGDIGRLMFENPTTDAEDYCEVYCPDGSVRRGRFCEVTLVRVPQHAENVFEYHARRIAEADAKMPEAIRNVLYSR